MAELSFNLAELFQQAFGYKTQAFQPQFDAVSGDQFLSRAEQGASGSPYYAKDALGMEYFMPVSLVFANGSQTSPGVKRWNLPYPVISVSSRKTIVETALTERRGSVKELINIQDYEITIKGFIISQENDFPETEVTQLRNVYEQNVAISIQCPLTDIFLLRPDRSGSDEAVITDLKLLPVTGYKNVRPYELRMVSDEPFNLTTVS